jgi:ATP-dependent helicase/nuclease subunit B
VLSDDAAQGPIIQLIDYKTGSAATLRELVAQPLEDTQLAFYAALMARQSDAVGDIAACYLPLDAGDTVKAIDHPDVEFSAEQLIEGIGIDLTRLRAGAVMPALGEARACDYCDARGLCRRDHWPPAAADDGSAAP